MKWNTVTTMMAEKLGIGSSELHPNSALGALISHGIGIIVLDGVKRLQGILVGVLRVRKR